jgi:hypothetical protein
MPTSSSLWDSRRYLLHRTDFLYSSVLLVPVRSELTAHGSRYIAAKRTQTYSKHISRDRYPPSLLARRSDLQRTQLHLLLRIGPCLQSCCLATPRSNPLKYISGYSSIDFTWNCVHQWCVSLSIVRVGLHNNFVSASRSDLQEVPNIHILVVRDRNVRGILQQHSALYIISSGYVYYILVLRSTRCSPWILLSSIFHKI